MADPAPVAVSGRVEETLRKHLVARARERCAPVIEDFNKCTSENQFTVIISCRTQFNEMNECLHRYSNDEEFDRLKRHWMAKEANKAKLKETKLAAAASSAPSN
jgi:COX assembly protein 1